MRLPILVLLLLVSCQNRHPDCSTHLSAWYDADSLLLRLHAPLPEPLQLNEEEGFVSNIFYDFEDTVTENYWKSEPDVLKAMLGIHVLRSHSKMLDFGISYPDVLMADTVGYLDYFGAGELYPDSVFDRSLLENRVDLRGAGPQRISYWLHYSQESRVLGIELYNKIYVLDSRSCLNCEDDMHFYVDWSWGGNFPDLYLFKFRESIFLFVSISQQRYNPWFWIFDITDSTDIKYFGFHNASEGSFYEYFNDFNDDGNIDVAIIERQTACNRCDTLQLQNDSLDPADLHCRQMVFYTYRNGKMERLCDAKGNPYYISLAWDFWIGPFRVLSKNLWKEIEFEGEHFIP